MKFLNSCEEHRDKSVKLTITSIIVSNTHAPLQLYGFFSNHITVICNDTDDDHNYGVTIQSCSGACMLVMLILFMVSCKGLSLHLFHSVHFKIWREVF